MTEITEIEELTFNAVKRETAQSIQSVKPLGIVFTSDEIAEIKRELLRKQRLLDTTWADEKREYDIIIQILKKLI